MENGRPLGIAALNSVLAEIDRLSELSWQDFIDGNFYLAQEDKLDLLQFQEIKNRFV
jgi:hypothetical protein